MGFIFSHLLVQVNILLIIITFFQKCVRQGTRLVSVSGCKIKVILIPKFLLKNLAFLQSFVPQT